MITEAERNRFIALVERLDISSAEDLIGLNPVAREGVLKTDCPPGIFDFEMGDDE